MIYHRYIKKSKLPGLLTMGLLCLAFFLIAADEVHIVKNDFYSISIPKSWESYQHSNGYIPKERPCGPYKLYYLTWNTPLRGATDIPNAIVLSIDTYKRNDGKKLTMKELETFEKGYIAKSKILSREEKVINRDKKRVIIKRSTMENGTEVEYCESYLYVCTPKVVHSLKILTRTSMFKLPETRKTIDKIFASFH